MSLNLRKSAYRFKRLIGREELKLYLDVSNCNLRCAMCPRGGVSELKNEGKGLMDFGIFNRIIDKFIREDVKIGHFEVGNWGEPLLNPELPRMIRYLKDKWKPVWMGQDGRIGISTNLNYLKNPLELLESGVTNIRVSISGMTHETYSKNHIGGNIETVLRNILELADIKKKKNLKNIALAIGFQDLIYNRSEGEQARRFCAQHGLGFELVDIHVHSVEDNIAFHQDRQKLEAFYKNFIDLERELMLMRAARKVEKCQFRRSVVTVNYDGQVYRCCAVFEQKYFMGPIFDYKIRDIPRIKSEICTLCARTPISWR